MASPKIHRENGIVVGNVTSKRTMGNPIARKLVERFDQRISNLLSKVQPRKILEVGCGEGDIVSLALKNTESTIVATDISKKAISEAQSRIQDQRVTFEQLNIHGIPETDKYRADLVVCCEVLEHLEDPIAGLAKLHSLTTSHCLVSVPREPLWRALNMVRGAYLKDLGNTPGHLQHWSKREFISFVSSSFTIEEVLTPTPWTIILCRKK